MMRIISFSVPPQEDGIAVGAFLLRRGLSRTLLIRLKNTPDGLTVGGHEIYVTHRLRAGDLLRIALPEDRPNETIVPVPLPLDLVYEDEDLLIINKPAGMPVHPSQGNRDNTVANALAALFCAQGTPFVFRAIGRLDSGTSGLLVLAKNALSACLLSAQAKDKRLQREYLALCEGKTPPAGVIDAPIGRAPQSVLLRQIDFAHGVPAVTHFERLGYRGEISLVRLSLDTGRTHQIRVHMASIGHPLLGDFLYHPDDQSLPRTALHAARLSLLQPVTQKPFVFASPLPDDMQQVWEKA